MATSKLRDRVLLRTANFEKTAHVLMSGNSSSLIQKNKLEVMEAFEQWRRFDRKLWRKASWWRRMRYKFIRVKDSIPIWYEHQKYVHSEHGEEDVVVPPASLRLAQNIFTASAPVPHGDEYLLNARLVKLFILGALDGVHPKNCLVHVKAIFVDQTEGNKVLMFDVYRQQP